MLLATLAVAAVAALAGTPSYAAAVLPDVDDLRGELSRDGVAVHDAHLDRQALAGVVADARGNDLRLSVVVLGEDLPGGLSATESLASELRQGATTVLVLTPAWLGADSGELSERALARALDAAEDAGADDVAAARQFTDAALGRGGVPWVPLVLAGVAAALAAVAAGRWWEVRRRRRTDAAALTQITQQLRSELSGLADRVVALEPQVALADEEMRSRYARASAAYRDVREELERPVASRAAGDRIRGRLHDIGRTLDEVGAALDDARRSW